MSNEPFVGYPRDHVLAAFTSREEAARAIDDARAEGVPDGDLSAYSGAEGAEALDASGTQHGLTGVALRSLQFLMTNRDRLAEYEEAVNEGGVVLAGKAEDDERKHTLSAIFQRNGGSHVRYYGAFAVEELNVDPSRTRAD